MSVLSNHSGLCSKEDVSEDVSEDVNKTAITIQGYETCMFERHEPMRIWCFNSLTR